MPSAKRLQQQTAARQIQLCAWLVHSLARVVNRSSCYPTPCCTLGPVSCAFIARLGRAVSVRVGQPDPGLEVFFCDEGERSSPCILRLCEALPIFVVLYLRKMASTSEVERSCLSDAMASSPGQQARWTNEDKTHEREGQFEESGSCGKHPSHCSVLRVASQSRAVVSQNGLLFCICLRCHGKAWHLM